MVVKTESQVLYHYIRLINLFFSFLTNTTCGSVIRHLCVFDIGTIISLKIKYCVYSRKRSHTANNTTKSSAYKTYNTTNNVYDHNDLKVELGDREVIPQ